MRDIKIALLTRSGASPRPDLVIGPRRSAFAPDLRSSNTHPQPARARMSRCRFEYRSSVEALEQPTSMNVLPPPTVSKAISRAANLS